MPDLQVQEIQKSVGETLAEVRRQRNLTVQEVANQLRLDARIIEALETENYDILPSPAYTRGYLRSYAKILSVDADRIIAQYNNKAPQPPEIIPDVRHPTQVSSSDKPVKAFTYLVTFILVLLVLAWVQSNFVVREAPAPIAVSPEPEISTPYQLGPFEEQAAAPVVSDVPDLDGALTAPETAEQDAAVQVLETPARTETEPTPNAGNAPQPLPTSGQQDAPPGLTVNETHSTQIADVTAGPDNVSMKLSADSWIEIYDAFDHRMLMTLARSGEEFSLRGTAPFRVKLGFSQGVTLYFNGDYFDPAPYSHGGVATFTLGE